MISARDGIWRTRWGECLQTPSVAITTGKSGDCAFVAEYKGAAVVAVARQRADANANRGIGNLIARKLIRERVGQGSRSEYLPIMNQ